MLYAVFSRKSDNREGTVGNRKLVTFDIFDTLIRRKCGKPHNVFRLVYNVLPEACRVFLGGDGSDKFVQLRITSESWLRQQFSESEITLQQIWSLMSDKGLPIDPNEGAGLEMQLELSQCERHPQGALLFEKYSSSADVAYISDMYLSKECIAEILLNAGYATDVHRLFVSSDVGITKSSGNLYRHVRKNYPNHKWEHHIGDNFHSDVVQARKYVRKPIHFVTASNECELETAIASQTDAHHLEKPTLVTKFLGPVLLSYAIWLERQRCEQNLDCLLFMARDCNLLADIYHDVTFQLADKPETRYAEVSRAVLAPLMVEKAIDHFEYLFSIWDEKSPINAAKRYPFVDWASANPASLERYPANGVRLAENTKSLMSYESLQLLQRTKAYVNHLIGDKSRIGIVDLGWYLNAQQALSTIDHVAFHGIYLCTKSGYNLNVEPHKYSSLFFEHDEMAAPLIGNQTALEHMLALATNGSTVGYDENLNPIYGDNAMDVDATFLQQLRVQLKEFVAQNLKGYSQRTNQDLKSHIACTLERFLNYPTKLDVEQFAKMTIGTDHKESFPLIGSLVKLRGVIPTYRPTGWFGASKLVTNPILLTYWHVAHKTLKYVKQRCYPATVDGKRFMFKRVAF